MGSCDPESLRRCLRQTRFLTHSSPAEKLISQAEATFTLHFFCFLSYAASLFGFLQELVTSSLEYFMASTQVSESYWDCFQFSWLIFEESDSGPVCF